MNIKSQLTILTLPIPEGPLGTRSRVWLATRALNYSLRGLKLPLYGGHFAVTRSIIEGSQKANLPTNYNPSNISDVAKKVHVLSGVLPLRQMISWKRKGIIDQLSCGPNIVLRSNEHNSIIASQEVDAVVNHCDWACEFWAHDHPKLLQYCLYWGAGVDHEYWKPPRYSRRDRILILDKRDSNQDPSRIFQYVDHLKACGWPVDIITRTINSGYTHIHYRSLLHRAALLVGFTVGSESQGIAWAEAWASDVPTLILQQTRNSIQGISFRCSTAPFLSSETGMFFNDFSDFKSKFSYWSSRSYAFSPRRWVLSNMTDELASRDLYCKLQKLNFPKKSS